MTDAPRIVYRPRLGATPEREIDALAAVYSYVLHSYQMRDKGKEGGPTTAPDNDAKDSKNDCAVTKHCT